MLSQIRHEQEPGTAPRAGQSLEAPRIVLLGALFALVGMALPSAAGVSPGAHISTTALDCTFTAWQTEPDGPVAAGARLVVGADLRCATAKNLLVRVTVTDGIDDVAAAAGPPNLLDGIGAGPRVGTVVAPFVSSAQGTQLQVTGSVPVPAAGHVYTVNAIVELTSGCGRNLCSSYPPAPAAPWAPGLDLSPVATEACMGTIDTYDYGCQYQFTVLGA